MRSLMTLTFKGVVRSIAAECLARDLGQRLASGTERIDCCHITFDRHTPDLADGPSFKVTIHLSLPGAEIHADNILPNGAGHADVHGALRAAYDNARRQLETFKRTSVAGVVSAAVVQP